MDVILNNYTKYSVPLNCVNNFKAEQGELTRTLIANNKVELSYPIGFPARRLIIDHLVSCRKKNIIIVLPLMVKQHYISIYNDLGCFVEDLDIARNYAVLGRSKHHIISFGHLKRWLGYLIYLKNKYVFVSDMVHGRYLPHKKPKIWVATTMLLNSSEAFIKT